MIGTTLCHYRITGRLGAGGMGEVYRATDTKLEREVALKVLPENMASDPDRLKRFRREARTVAVLNHPHIVTIFSVEEDQSTHFITMELVNGRSLDQMLAGSEPAARDLFFAVAIPLADAVAAAHARGIVHRDLKPANIMLDDEGRLKVLDFGIAKIAPNAGSADAITQTMVTSVGGIVGTPSYMSPEQAQGLPVDQRSDVFSLATVLHELATGRCAFDADNMPAMLHAVVTREPRPVSQVRSDLAGLDSILDECFVKDPKQRRMTAARLRDELRAVHDAAPATSRSGSAARAAVPPANPAAAETIVQSKPDESDAGTPRSRRPVIAVLPFRSAAQDAELEEFAANLGNDVIDNLAGSSQAVVLPASSTQSEQGDSKDARQLGRDLNARYVVQGTARRGGSRLRIKAQLTSVESGTQIWSRQYDHDLSQTDLFDVCDEVGIQIAAAIGDVHGVIFEVERQRVQGRPISELDPWECIFVTLGYDKFIDDHHHRIATEALQRAITLDPGFALAWGYISWIASDEHVYGFNQRPRAMERAMSAARRAVELDPYSQMLRWLLSRVHFFNGDIEGFLSEGNKALELNSNDATVIGLIGLYSSLSGHWQRGEELMRRAMALNPSYPSYYHLGIGIDRFRQRRFDDALAEFRRLTFSNPMSQSLFTATFGHLGRGNEAQASLREYVNSLGHPSREDVAAEWKRFNASDEFLEILMEGLERAGFEDRPPE